MTKIFCDFHHGALFYSLQLLFEKRFGFELYRPVGLDWYHQGYWNVYPHIDTANQFLSLDMGSSFEEIKKRYPDYLMVNLQDNAKEISAGDYVIPDPINDSLQRGITLEQFKQTKFDLILSSIPQHIEPFNKLIRLYQPQAKHIFQVGNNWGQHPGVQNILASTSTFHVSPHINVCFYHQEFDLNIYKYQPPTSHTSVNSYIHIMQRLDLLDKYKKTLSHWTFDSYGAGMGKHLLKSSDIADAMKQSAFTWHVKPGGDGYGHTLFSSYACGRPAIIWKQYYNGQLGSKLLDDRVTCLDITTRSIHDNCVLLNRLSDPDLHARMCENAFNRFKEVVNFDEDELKVKKFLENLR